MAVFPVCQSTSFVLKEKLFIDDPDLDIFIVNTQNTFFQIFFAPILSTIAYKVNQVILFPDIGLNEYFQEGFLCLYGHDNVQSQGMCNKMLWIYPPYLLLIALFNILFLWLVKKTSAVHTYIILKASLPIGVFLFYFDWPLLPWTTPFGVYSIVGFPIILLSIVVFIFTTMEQERYKLACCSFRMVEFEKCLGDSTYEEVIVPEELNRKVINF